ncbi:MAG: hypothetical protein JW863_13080 [Chitinispirillaceae bacterium]|nr:hypothetical protein [Chitinispirillaceae bacterium]
MKRLQVGLVVGLVMLTHVSALDGNDLRFSGYLRNYTGVLASRDPEFAIIQNTVNLSLEYRRDKVGLKITPWVYHYPHKELELGLREAYLDMFLGPVDIRVGKQQIIWGKGEGVFITDIVTPKDMREFLLPDFEEIRIGINALKLNMYHGNHSVELVVVPQFEPTVLPETGSLWRKEPVFPVQPTIDSSRTEVPLHVENSEVFGKYSLISSAFDVDVMGGYMWDADPAMHVHRVADPQTGRLQSITVTPRHHRLAVGGAAFSSPIGDFIVRGEGAWYHGKYFSTTDAADADGVVKKDYVNYLLGIDYTLWETRVSTQFIQRVILEHDDYLADRQFDNMMTVLVSRDFLRETLTLDVFAYIGLYEPDALIRPRATYILTDGLSVQLGANLFAGDRGKFGQFDDNDMVYLKTRFSF